MILPPNGAHPLEQCPVRSPCLMMVNVQEMTVLITGEQPSWLVKEHYHRPLKLKSLLVPTQSPHHYLTAGTDRLLYVCAHPLSSPHHMLLLACDVTDLDAESRLCLRLTQYGVIEAYSMEGRCQNAAMDDILLNRPIMSYVHEQDVGVLCMALNDRSDCRVRWQVNPNTSYWDEEHDDNFYAWANIYVQEQKECFMCIVEMPEATTGSYWSMLNFSTHPTQPSNHRLLHMVQMRLIENSVYHAFGLTIRAFTKLSTMAILSLTRGNHVLIQKNILQLKANLRHHEMRPSIQFLLSLLTNFHILDTPDRPRQFVEDTLDAFANSLAKPGSDPTPQSIV